MTQAVVHDPVPPTRVSCASSRVDIVAAACVFPRESRFDRLLIGCGKPCSTGCSRESTNRACSIYSPAAARSVSKRCRAVLRRSLSSRKIDVPQPPSKPSRANGRRRTRAWFVKARSRGWGRRAANHRSTSCFSIHPTIQICSPQPQRRLATGSRPTRVSISKGGPGSRCRRCRQAGKSFARVGPARSGIIYFLFETLAA
jgi:hypothetical protein